MPGHSSPGRRTPQTPPELRRDELVSARVAVALPLALALLPFLLFADAVCGRVVFYERDILAYWVPAIERFVAAVAEGAWPLWDPLTNFGRPMLADPSFQVGYPPTWLNLVMPPGAYYTLFVVAHVAWAGIGALRLARAWGIGLAGGAWAGAVWMLSGPFLSFVSLYHHFAGAAWIARLSSKGQRRKVSGVMSSGLLTPQCAR